MSSNSSNESEKFQPSSSSKSSEKSKSRVYFCKDRNRVVIESDEFYISELCDLERDFEDEFFIECDPKELSLFYARNGRFLIYNLEGRLTLRRPLRKKLRMRWFFDVSEVKESSFF